MKLLSLLNKKSGDVDHKEKRARTRKPEVPYEEKVQILKEAKEDPRFKEYVRSCLNCGVCSGVCPSHRFFDFSPRIVVQNLKSDDPELVYGMMDEYIWACAQCFACSVVCPVLNNPGGAVSILREIAVKKGLPSAEKVLRPYSRILYKLFTTGTQLSPDMMQPDFFKDWGPKEAHITEDLKAKRKAIPVPTLQNAIESAWEMDESTARELYEIHKESGALDMIKKIQPNTHFLVEEKFEEQS